MTELLIIVLAFVAFIFLGVSIAFVLGIIHETKKWSSIYKGCGRDD